jgi:hypothetical protein
MGQTHTQRERNRERERGVKFWRYSGFDAGKKGMV